MVKLYPHQQSILDELNAARAAGKTAIAMAPRNYGRTLGKSLSAAIMVKAMIDQGMKVYNYSLDPEKCGPIVDVTLPPEFMPKKMLPDPDKVG